MDPCATQKTMTHRLRHLCFAVLSTSDYRGRNLNFEPVLPRFCWSAASFLFPFSSVASFTMADAANRQKKPAGKGRKKKPAAEKEEPKIKWKRSQAKALLRKDILEGRVPLESGPGTMQLKDIYNLRPEFAEYQYSKFSSRLSSLRKTIKECNDRAALDQEAFDNYKKNHQAALFSHKGYIQWQGSEAQALCRKDIKHKRHDAMSRMELYGSRPEYYENFPLDVFRAKLNQEIRTAKYLHTLNVKGRDGRKKK